MAAKFAKLPDIVGAVPKGEAQAIGTGNGEHWRIGEMTRRPWRPPLATSSFNRLSLPPTISSARKSRRADALKAVREEGLRS